MKIILFVVDGMRPDGLKKCGNEFLEELSKVLPHAIL